MALLETRTDQTALADSDIQALRAQVRGPVIDRDDPAYDQVRKLYNGTIDKRPRLIARCVDVADVVAAVKFGRGHELLVAIHGGGHNGPGLGSCDGGIVIDLSLMKGVRVHPTTRSVRVDAGCTSGDVDHATHEFGLAVPFGIVSTTGVAGLTLGIGSGYLRRKHGLTIPTRLLWWACTWGYWQLQRSGREWRRTDGRPARVSAAAHFKLDG